MAGTKDRSDLICVGAVTGVHGVRGVLTIRPFTENAQNLTAYGPVRTHDGSRTFELEVIGSKKGLLLVRIDNIADRTAAEALKGTELFVPRTALPDIEDESWYQADLVGLDVRDNAGASLGRVKAVQNFGAGDLLEIHLNDENRDVLLPFTREIVPVVDIRGGFLTIDPPEGLFEE